MVFDGMQLDRADGKKREGKSRKYRYRCSKNLFPMDYGLVWRLALGYGKNFDLRIYAVESFVSARSLLCKGWIERTIDKGRG